MFKPTLKDGTHKPIISRRLGEKQMRMIYATDGTAFVKNIRTPKEDRQVFCISDDEVLQLAKWACEIEDHYTAKRNKYTPMDIEWAKDGQVRESNQRGKQKKRRKKKRQKRKQHGWRPRVKSKKKAC